MKEQRVVEFIAFRAKSNMEDMINAGWLYKKTVVKYKAGLQTYVVMVFEKEVQDGKENNEG